MIDREEFFMALADNTRLRLLNLLSKGEICVCYFTEVLDELQPKVSRHLAVLRKANLVETRRDGKWIYYRISEPQDDYAKAVLEKTLLWAEQDNEMKEDFEKLIKVCCQPQTLVTIGNAPRLNIENFQQPAD